ncbi:MAG: phosphoenolpyruvate--protein phosphotransferase [Alphaproteobacteria bacterium]
MTKELEGLAGSAGIAFGEAWIFEAKELKIDHNPITSKQVDEAKQQLKEAQQKVDAYLKAIYQSVLENQGEEEAEIFEGHLELLWDEDLIEEVHGLIENEHQSATAAIFHYLNDVIDDMSSLEDAYMRERAAEFKDLQKNIILALNGEDFTSLDNIPHNSILFAEDLTPTDTAQLDLEKVQGFVLEKGGPTSHVAILARNLELPAIMGISQVFEHIKNGLSVLIDGDEGRLIIEPDEKVTQLYHKKLEVIENQKKEHATLINEKAITSDGKHIQLFSNIGSANDVQLIDKFGSEGVGLFRSEFLFMESAKAPSEDFQYQAYSSVAKHLNGQAVILRLLDVGGDKPLPYMDFGHEENPFLGWRGIRIYQENYTIFLSQIRAALRAAYDGNLWVMIPMIINVDELKWVKDEISKQVDILKKEGHNINEQMKVGVMIETPAAALLAEQLAKEADFFSIGTNDLTQYTLAVDRGNTKISALYDSLHPAVIRLMKMACDAAHKHQIEIGICGELSSDLNATEILVGLGFDELSISGSSLPAIKAKIRSLDYEKCRQIVKKAIMLNNADDVRNLK